MINTTRFLASSLYLLIKNKNVNEKITNLYRTVSNNSLDSSIFEQKSSQSALCESLPKTPITYVNYNNECEVRLESEIIL